MTVTVTNALSLILTCSGIFVAAGAAAAAFGAPPERRPGGVGRGPVGRNDTLWVAVVASAVGVFGVPLIEGWMRHLGSVHVGQQAQSELLFF